VDIGRIDLCSPRYQHLKSFNMAHCRRDHESRRARLGGTHLMSEGLIGISPGRQEFPDDDGVTVLGSDTKGAPALISGCSRCPPQSCDGEIPVL
jgi:hypothetical protein